MAKSSIGVAAVRVGYGIGASAIALAAVTAASAQCVTDTNGACTITNSGASGAIATSGGRTVVNNSSTITGAPAISQSVKGSLLVNNMAGGTITGTGGVAISSTANQVLTISAAPQSTSLGTVVVNAGTINGDVKLADQGLRSIYVSAGGTLNGSLDLNSTFNNNPSATSGTFLYRGDVTGVVGPITGGNGVDFYGRSLTSSGTVSLGGALPTTFEAAAVEANGRDTAVTLVPVEGRTTPVEGVMLYGDGSFVNRTDLTLTSIAGSGIPANQQLLQAAIGYGGHVDKEQGVVFLSFFNGQVVSRGASLGNGLKSFTNEASINGDVRLTTAAFVNSGAMEGASNFLGTILTANAGEAFSFTNTAAGTIRLTDAGNRPPPVLFFGAGTAAVTIKSPFEVETPQAFSIDNAGLIDGGLYATVTASSLAFQNSGTINAFAESAVYLANGIDPDNFFEETVDAENVTFVNSGTIDGDVDLEVSTNELSFTNTGTIRVEAGSTAVEIDSDLVLEEDAQGNDPDAAILTFNNSGLIDGGVEAELAYASVNVTNSGEITSSSDDGATFEIDNESDNGQTVNFANNADGLIAAVLPGGAALIVGTSAGLDEDGGPPENPDAATSVTITNAGEIRADANALELAGAEYGLQPGQSYVIPTLALGVAAESAAGSTVSITNDATGVISAGGTDAVAVAVQADSLTLVNNGEITGSAGITLTPGTRMLLTSEELEVPQDMTFIAGAIQTVGSVDTIRNNVGGTITGSIDLGSQDDRIENYGTIAGDVFLGSGNDSFVQGITATYTGTADGGAGDDVFLIDTTGNGAITQALLDRFVGFETFSLIGTGTITSDADLGEVEISGGETADSFDNSGTVAAIDLGDGDNMLANGGTVEGDVTVGDGADMVTNNGTIEGNVVLGAGDNQLTTTAGSTIKGDVAGFEGADTVANSGTIAGDVALGAGNNQLVAATGSTIGGNVNTLGGADSVTNNGTIIGNVDLGTGNDRYTAAAGSSVGGATGGDGTDTLGLSFVGTEAAPTVLDLGQYQSFEAFEANGGTASVNGSFTTGSLTINDGRIIGQAGSTITAATVAVTDNAIFGSAGAVNGDISVAGGGTLSPGASPGTMTVAGNVALAANSTSLFELTPTITDQLLISGTLTIASGATLTLTGERPLTPGSTLDLIVADGGITGSFTTVNKPATILGFISQNATRIQLLGQFATAPGFSPQTTATVNYVNGVLVAGQGSAGLIAALPSLLTAGGATNSAAFAQLNPEAYASATQISVENGLTLAQASRAGAAAATGDQPGMFTFIQGLGNWRKLDGSGAQGTSRANVHSYGVLGGIGFGSADASIGGFVGYLDGTQRIGALGARTEADGIVAGLTGHYASNGFDMSALLAYDGSKADTSRTLPGGGRATASYRLRGWIADASLGYSVPVGGDWALKPEAGLTYVSTRRGGLTEAGGSPFALAVARRKSDATFIDGALTLKGGVAAGATVHPWVSAGVRHQLSGEATSASGSFIGATSSLTVAGVERRETLATVGGGLSVELTPQFGLFAAYRGEFGGNGEGHNLNGGLRFRF